LLALESALIQVNPAQQSHKCDFDPRELIAINEKISKFSAEIN